jgi:hypothetical protein
LLQQLHRWQLRELIARGLQRRGRRVGRAEPTRNRPTSTARGAGRGLRTLRRKRRCRQFSSRRSRLSTARADRAWSAAPRSSGRTRRTNSELLPKSSTTTRARDQLAQLPPMQLLQQLSGMSAHLNSAGGWPGLANATPAVVGSDAPNQLGTPPEIIDDDEGALAPALEPFGSHRCSCCSN